MKTSSPVKSDAEHSVLPKMNIWWKQISYRKSLTHLRAATKSSIYLAPSPNLASGPSSREMVPTLKQRYYIYNVNLIFTVTEHQHWLPAPNVSVIYSVPFSSFIPWHIFNITILTMSDGKISGLLPSSFQPISFMHFIGIKWKNVIRSSLYLILYVNFPQSLVIPSHPTPKQHCNVLQSQAVSSSTQDTNFDSM